MTILKVAAIIMAEGEGIHSLGNIRRKNADAHEGARFVGHEGVIFVDCW